MRATYMWCFWRRVIYGISYNPCRRENIHRNGNKGLLSNSKACFELCYQFDPYISSSASAIFACITCEKQISVTRQTSSTEDSLVVMVFNSRYGKFNRFLHSHGTSHSSIRLTSQPWPSTTAKAHQQSRHFNSLSILNCAICINVSELVITELCSCIQAWIGYGKIMSAKKIHFR